MELLRSIAYEVREPTPEEKAAPITTYEIVDKNDHSMPPGVGAVRAIHTIVTVVGLDLDAQTVTLKNPNGEVSTVKARYPERLKKVKVGDTVAITFTEGVAIAIEPFGGV